MSATSKTKSKRGKGQGTSARARRQARKKRQARKGKRYTPEQREHALTLVAAGMSQERAGKSIGATGESVRRWIQRAKATGTMPVVPTVEAKPSDQKPAPAAATAVAVRSIYAPADPGQGLSSQEEAAVLEYKRRHPSYGPAQIRTQLKRFKGWRVSIKAIGRLLRAHGYELVHRGSRPKGAEEPTRFEAPRRNALWQMDFAEMRVGDDKLHVLVALDDFSRFIVGRSYHPQGGGKVEAVIGTLRRELWDVEHFDSRAQAEYRLAAFIADYNERRAHMALDGLTPADRFFGRGDRVLEVINALSRKRQGVLARYAPDGAPIEELGSGNGAPPMEVLRLVLVDGRMELRLCGARVQLGPVEL